MPRKKGKEEKESTRQEAYVFLLMLYIVGIGLMIAGYLEAILLILVAILFTIAYFPSVSNVIKSIIKGVESYLENRKKRTVKRPSISPSNIEESMDDRSQFVNELFTKISEFRPYKRPHNEKQLEDMLMQYLRVFYPSLRTQLSYERTKIDGQIEGVGIELKYQPNEADLDRLFGQVEKYSRHLDHVIVVIAYERSRESVEYFRKRLKRSNLYDRASVISIS